MATQEPEVSKHWHITFLVWVIMGTGIAPLYVASDRAAAADSAHVQQGQGEVTSQVIACSPDKPVVRYGKGVRLRVWAAAASAQPLHYGWTATGGRLQEHGTEAQWDFTDVRPGPYAATVRVSNARGAVAECVMQVIVKTPLRARRSRETGRSLLTPDQNESEGYGLYSYVLLGTPPTEHARAQYLETVRAYLQLIVDITRLVEYVPHRELNVTYMPVTQPPAGQSVAKASAEWLLQHYDYARARVLLHALPGNLRGGPYIVSTLKPLDVAGNMPDRYLLQDLSSVLPHLISLWIKEFMNQAAQERFWEPKTAARLTLKLRTTIGVLAEGLPELHASLQQLIAWVPG